MNGPPWMLVDGQPQNTTPDEVWFNDGLGNFTDNGQRLGDDQSFAEMLGDLNGDDFLDAVVGSQNGGPDSYQVWRGDGNGRFSAEKSIAYR